MERQMEMGLQAAPLLGGGSIHKVCIIGGGVSGVAAARVLLAEGLDCVLLEQTDSLGGVWASNYSGFGIQVPAALYEFPDGPLEVPGGSADFCKGPVVNAHIKEYAEKHGVLKVARLLTRVEKMRRRGAQQWEVVMRTDDGRQETHIYDLVVVATGVYGRLDKFMPKLAGGDAFKGEVMHSVDFTDVQKAAGKRVVTVGYGKSALDCAMFSAEAGAESTLLFREAHWPVPRKILGLIPFEFATFSRFGAAILLPGYASLGPIERVLHCIPGLLTFVWWLVGKIFSLQLGLTGDLLPKKGFIADFWEGHGVVVDPKFFPMVHSGKVKAKRGEIEMVKEGSVVLKGGECLPADLLIFATGFRRNWGFLPEELTEQAEEDGLWLYRQMIHPDFPTLCFLNSNTTTFTNITTAAVQSRWLYEVVTQGLLPSAKEMRTEVRREQDWKRQAMPQSGSSRATMIQTHQVHYYDQLLKDLGASIRRKRGCCFSALREALDPYRPRDYDTVVNGEYKWRKGEKTTPGSEQSSFCWELVVVGFQLALLVLVVYFAIDIGRAACYRLQHL